jgi:type II secretory pathway component PulF
MMNHAMSNAVANTMTSKGKSAVISARIVTLVNEGVPLAEAVDAVLGRGVYMSIASDIWNALRAQERS